MINALGFDSKKIKEISYQSAFRPVFCYIDTTPVCKRSFYFARVAPETEIQSHRIVIFFSFNLIIEMFVLLRETIVFVLYFCLYTFYCNTSLSYPSPLYIFFSLIVVEDTSNFLPLHPPSNPRVILYLFLRSDKDTDISLSPRKFFQNVSARSKIS